MARYNRPKLSRTGDRHLLVALVWVISLLIWLCWVIYWLLWHFGAWLATRMRKP